MGESDQDKENLRVQTTFTPSLAASVFLSQDSPQIWKPASVFLV